MNKRIQKKITTGKFNAKILFRKIIWNKNQKWKLTIRNLEITFTQLLKIQLIKNIYQILSKTIHLMK